MNRGTIVGLVVLAAGAVGVWQLYRIQSEPAEDDEASTPAAPGEATALVQVGAVVRTNLQSGVAAFGTVEPAPGAPGQPAANLRITAPAAGLVAETLCAEGQAVKRGDPLFRMDRRLADIALKKAKEAVDFASKNLERQKKLQQLDGTSQKQILEAQQLFDAASGDLAATQVQFDLLTVAAPTDGTVVKVAAQPGETVDAGRDLAEMVDLKRLVIAAAVPSREAVPLRTGQPVDIESGGGETVRGALSFIDSRIDPQTDTVKLRISLPDGAALRDGQFVRIRIVHTELRDRLAAPEESLVRTEEGEQAVILVEGEQAAQKVVKAGARDAGLVEIEADGIKEGTPIVTVGAYALPDKIKIRVVKP